MEREREAFDGGQVLTNNPNDPLYPPIAPDIDGNTNSTIPSPKKLTATASECPTSLTTRGKTSADIANGEVPAVGEYATMNRIPKTETRGTRASPSTPLLNENARTSMKINMGTKPRSNMVARPT